MKTRVLLLLAALGLCGCTELQNTDWLDSVKPYPQVPTQAAQPITHTPSDTTFHTGLETDPLVCRKECY